MVTGSLPFDILFFCAGIWAKRNNWLPTIFNLPAGQVTYLWTVNILIMGTYLASLCYLYFGVDNSGLLPSKNGEVPDEGSTYFYIFGPLIVIMCGVFVFTFS